MISYPIDFNTSICDCTLLSGIVSPDLPVKVNAWSVNSVSVLVFGSTEMNLTFAFWSSLSYVILMLAFGSVIFGGLYPCSGFAGFTGTSGVPFPSFGVYPSLWGIICVISPVFVGSFGSLGNGIGSPSLPVVGSTGIQLPIFV